MDIIRLFKHFLLTVALLTGAGLATAEEGNLCSAFKEGVVDESLLATMLSAADNGHLFRIQPTSSQVGFCVDSKLSRITGNFRDFQGGMSLDPGSNASGNGQTMVLIKADSLDTEGAIINSLLKSEKFFDVENHPELLFVSNGFEWTGPDTAVLKGDLTMRGITKPVIFNVTLEAFDAKPNGKAQKILVKATTTINRVDFGIEGLSSLVDSNVQLCMSVEALKYQA